jgi:hypothetical protein
MARQIAGASDVKILEKGGSKPFELYRYLADLVTEFKGK